MRISDWSSDVCSSDLYLHDGVDQARMPAEPPEGLVEGVGREGGSDDARLFAEILLALLREDARHLDHQDSRLLAREDFRQNEVTFLEIGRASCRERVCQYV